jgi:diguanylate cyclase (GGDEF)-like protein/PAS domain S-box-containing protein
MHTGSQPDPHRGQEKIPPDAEAIYAIAELAAHGVALCDAQGYCLYANAALRSLTGYEEQELHSLPLHELLNISAFRESAGTKEERFSVRRKDGTSVDARAQILPLHGDDSSRWLIQILPAFSHDEAQSASQLTLQLAKEAAGIGTWERDMTTDACKFGPIAASIMGLPPERKMLLAHEWKAMIEPEDFSRVIHAEEEARQTGGLFKVEYRLRRLDGSRAWLSVLGVLQCDAEGRLRRAAGVMLDITEHKRLEELEKERAREAHSVAETNAKFRAFFYQSSNYSGLLALDGTLLEANAVSLKACGFSKQQVLGRKFWLCGWWSAKGSVREKIRRAVGQAAAGEAFRDEVPYFTADGSEHMAEVTMAPVTNEAGQRLYIAATGIDITERKKAERALRATEERYRLLAELSPDAILVEQQEKIVYANSSAAKLFCAAGVDYLLGFHLEDLVPPEFQEAVRERRAAVIAGDEYPPLLEMQMSRLDGKSVDIQALCGKMMWEGKAAIQILVRDVSELKQTRDKLRQASERLKLAIEGSGEGIWDWDIVNCQFSFNGGLNHILLGGNETQAQANVWLEKIHPDDRERVLETFQATLQDQVPIYECEYRLRDKEGAWRWVWARGVIVERDDEGKPLTMTGTLSDITVRKESSDLAWRHANLDALTGLPNRRLFRERLDIELARLNRSRHSLALLFIDLDGFKQVNDLYGHDAGDLLLMEVAHRVQSCIRQTDTVARLGGDEFTVMLTELDDLPHVEIVCQKILASLSESFHVGKDVAYISGSIGVALYPLDTKSADELIRKADQAMYAAKYSGKNQFHYFTKEMDDSAHLRLQITNELRRALQGNQLVVHYQPVLDLHSGRVVKAEALLRWTHPVLGDIGPAQFVPLAEEAGLIQKLGNWVFREAALCCKRCSDRLGGSFQIGVNKSPMQFMARESDSNWLQFLGEIGLSGSAISVEITEGVLLRSTAVVTEKLLGYRNAGVELAVDDFGTGYSSMAYLHKFNIDYVKIDQSFVHDLAEDGGCRAIVEAIITMAHKLGKKVIAEGIETEAQRAILAGAGCDYGQGFLFSKAVPPEQLLSMIGNGAYFRPANRSGSDMPPA